MGDQRFPGSPNQRDANQRDPKERDADAASARADNHVVDSDSVEATTDAIGGDRTDGGLSSTSGTLRRQRLGDRYVLREPIASGGMGVIYRALDRDLDREVAIKMLHSGLPPSGDITRRFIAEARIGGRLQHPGIAPIYDIGQFDDGQPYFAMKLVRGETLAELAQRMLQSPRGLHERRNELFGIFEQICQTIAYTHSREVIHRDLKPANIMVGAFGEVQVMDWGLAKVLRDDRITVDSDEPAARADETSAETDPENEAAEVDATRTGIVLGTLQYMPPEQALGLIDQVGKRSDVFGLGAILCELLTGNPPYRGETRDAVMRAAMHGDLHDASQRLDQCGADPDAIQLAKQCLSPRLCDRPVDGEQVAAAAKAYLLSVEARLQHAQQQVVVAAARATESRKRRRLTAGFVMALATVLITTGSLVLWKQYRENQLAQERTKLLSEQLRTAEKIKVQSQQIETANLDLAAANRTAMEQRQRAVDVLRQTQLSRALTAAQSGQSELAPLWFAEALAIEAEESDDGTPSRITSLQAKHWTDQSPLPVQKFDLPYPGSEVTTLEFQPAGSLLLIARRGDLVVWDYRRDEVIRQDWGRCSQPAWSPDGRRLLILSDTGTLTAHDTGTWQPTIYSSTADPAGPFVSHPAGEWVAFGTRDIRLVDGQTEVIASLPLNPTETITDLAFSDDGDTLLARTTEAIFHVDIDFEGGTTSTSDRFDLPPGQLGAPSLIDAGGGVWIPEGDGSIQRWSQQAARPMIAAAVRDISTRMDGAPRGQFVWVARGETSDLFDCRDADRTGPVRFPLPRDVPPQILGVFSADAATLMTLGTDRQARLWNTRDPSRPATSVPHPHPLAAAAIDPEGRFFATIDSQGTVRVFHRQMPPPVDVTHDQFGPGLMMSADGRWIGSVSLPRLSTTAMDFPAPICISADRSDGAWSPLCVTKPMATLLGREGDVVATVEVIEGEPRFFLRTRPASENGSVEEANTTVSVRLTDRAVGIAQHPHLPRWAVLDELGRVNLIDPQGGEIVRRLPIPDFESTAPQHCQLRYTPDGKWLVVVTGGRPNRIEVIDAELGQRRFPPLRPVIEKGSCTQAVISENGRWLATAVRGNHAAQVWNLQTGEERTPPLLHPGGELGITDMAFASDDSELITAHEDGQVRTWNIESGSLSGKVLEHGGAVTSFVLVDNDRLIAAVDSIGFVSLWNRRDRLPLAPPFQIAEELFDVVSSDRSTILWVTGRPRGDDRETALFHLELRSFLDAPHISVDEYRAVAELIGGRRVVDGGTALLDGTQWDQRFRQLRKLESLVAGRLAPETAQQKVAFAANWLQQGELARARGWIHRVDDDARLKGEGIVDDRQRNRNAGESRDDSIALQALTIECLSYAPSQSRIKWNETFARWQAFCHNLGKVYPSRVHDLAVTEAWLVGMANAAKPSAASRDMALRLLRPQGLQRWLQQQKNAQNWSEIDRHMAILHGRATSLQNANWLPAYLAWIEAKRNLKAPVEEIRTLLEMCSSVESSSADLAFEWLLFEQSRYDIDNLLKRFEHLHELLPQSAARHRAVARIVASANRLDDAEAYYRRSLEIDGNRIDPIVSEAHAFVLAGQFDQAAFRFALLRKLTPESIDWPYHHARTLYMSGRSEYCRSVCQELAPRLRTTNPKETEMLVSIRGMAAGCLLEEGHAEEALREANAALDIATSLPPASGDSIAAGLHRVIVLALIVRDQTDEAFAHLSKLNPESWDTIQLGQALLVAWREGHVEQGLAWAERWQAIDDRKINTRLALTAFGCLLRDSGREVVDPSQLLAVELATLWTERPVSCDPDSVSAAIEVDYHLFDFQKAVDWVERLDAEDLTLSKTARYNAACCALRAAEIALLEERPEASTRAEVLVSKALTWLQQELLQVQAELPEQDFAGVQRLRRELFRWLYDRDLQLLRPQTEIAERTVRMEKIDAALQSRIDDLWDLHRGLFTGPVAAATAQSPVSPASPLPPQP
jgi:serine/threonine protein kinase/WD40 repeat protein/tetratricopeptide (TPR) repeat protein